MPVRNENNKLNKIAIFTDYIPAEIRKNKDWLIVYYAKNPVNDKLERMRLRVPKSSNTTERLKLAKKLAAEINLQLQNGWSPFINESGKNYKTWNDGIVDFEKYLQRQLKDKILRADTLRTYNSNLNLVKQFIIEKKLKITFVLQINKAFCVQYLDWVYMDRVNSARTRNNHLIFLRLFCNYFVGRGILAENPTNGLKYLPKITKKRIYIPSTIRLSIENELKNWDNSFLCVCFATYYCMIRNTELGKLKVSNVNLELDSIFIPKEISKNKKDETITIPVDFKSVLQNHLKNSNVDDFLFSSNKFLPGTKKMPIRKIQNHWDKLKAKLKFKDEYQFYSLKDTGITDLFLKGLPSINIRNQARHSSVQITELYTSKNMNCDNEIKNANSKF